MDRGQLKNYIAKRAAKELRDGDIVNLGIGLPTYVPAYLPQGVRVILQSENGIIGTGPTPSPEEALPFHITDAGGYPAAVSPGGCFIDSATSFGLIRGGHVDSTILGALEVDEEGSLASWIVPGSKISGMGGAMDLMVGAKKVIVTMEHTVGGKHKILKKCRLPLTAANHVNLIITEMAVIQVTAKGLVLAEYNPEYTLGQIQAATEAALIVSDELKPME